MRSSAREDVKERWCRWVYSLPLSLPLAIMRSSVFRSRRRLPISICFPAELAARRWLAGWKRARERSEMASPIRVIPDILFLFRNQISQERILLPSSLSPAATAAFWGVRDKLASASPPAKNGCCCWTFSRCVSRVASPVYIYTVQFSPHFIYTCAAAAAAPASIC